MIFTLFYNLSMVKFDKVLLNSYAKEQPNSNIRKFVDEAENSFFLRTINSLLAMVDVKF